VPKTFYLYADSKAESKVERKQSVAKVAWTDLAKEVMHGDVLCETICCCNPLRLLQCNPSVKGRTEQHLSGSAHCVLVKCMMFSMQLTVQECVTVYLETHPRIRILGF